MARLLLALMAAFMLGSAQARLPITFEEAMDAYEADRMQEARSAFQRMAETGFARAQRQLGRMLLDGRGGAEDPVAGAAWIQLAAQAEPGQVTKPGSETSDSHLAPFEDQVEQRLPEWRRRFSATALREANAPRPCPGECTVPWSDDPMRTRESTETTVAGKPARLFQRAPRYPNELRRRGIPGYVEMAAWVGADGTFQDPHVIYSDPEWIFDTPALTALELWQVEWTDGAPDDGPRYVRQGISFAIDGHRWERKARRQYERIIEDWEDDVEAGYRAARMAYNLGFGDVVGGSEGLLDKTHRAARSGLARAQIDLYEHLIPGNGIAQDTQAALFWLKRAAYSGDALAQFLLSFHESLDPDLRHSLLLSAAETGCVPAVMTVLREQLATPASADKELLADLIDGLPEYWFMVDPDQSLVDEARAIISG